MADADDVNISVRFKHGIHTIYLFVDPLAPFSNVTAELVQILTERYPRGLTTSIDPPKTTVIPDDAQLVFGALSVPNDPSAGWKTIRVGDGESTPDKLGLKNNSLVAFAVVDDEDDDPEFEVEWPKEDEELYEQ
ncbi:hypothetical protein FZEAL_1499 [Fusarium zealandicum]|uniref:Uncharacterized protein n=1 Tax=Fusarium zealandicum TaxID=1053134 RepID=A0A8H4XNN1_9HYPO|nr:hypothetical protein FZEAL_1499 [Fusarium zealandicum]